MRTIAIGKLTSIRTLSKADLKAIYRWWNDSTLMAEVLAEDFSIEMKTLEEKYWPFWKNPSPRGPFMHVIYRNETPIGEINHSIEGEKDDTASVHMKIGEVPLWSRGYGKDALASYLTSLLSG